MGNNIKYIYIFCFAVLFSTILSCTDNIKKQSVNEVEKYGVIYFTKGFIHTITPVNCKSFFNDLGFSVYYIEIEDESFYKKILSNINTESNFETDEILDMRYRIELEGKIICIDYWGEYSINGKYKGEIKNFQEILEYIYENEDNSIQLEELPSLE